MKYSRRELGRAALLGAAGLTEGAAATLPSATFRFEDLTVKTSGKNKSRAVFDGETHTGFPVEMHMTELPPGGAPHPAHHHAHEEMILIYEGTMEVTISGKSTTLGPGSSAYVASNEEHGWRNVGTTNALYWVLAFGREK